MTMLKIEVVQGILQTQQFVEHTFGHERSTTINTYVVMKSGIKTVDSTGRSGPIPSEKAQQRLDKHKGLVTDENAQELDGQGLYTMGKGMKHGRVLIGDGAVHKAVVLVHAKSASVKPINPDDYERVVQENHELKHRNELLFEENSVTRDMVLSVFAEMGKEPPAALLRRLESIDARRQQTNGSPHTGSQSVDDRHISDNPDDEGNDDDDDYRAQQEFDAFLKDMYGVEGIDEEDIDEEDFDGEDGGGNFDDEDGGGNLDSDDDEGNLEED